MKKLLLKKYEVRSTKYGLPALSSSPEDRSAGKSSLVKLVIYVLCVFTVYSGLRTSDYVWAAGPNAISYQGRLRESGQPVSGIRNFNFKLFTAASVGTQVWTSGDIAVRVSSGIYSTQIGNDNLKNLDFADNDYWLEISVGGNAFTPREKISAVPYAFTASTATNVIGAGHIRMFGAPGNHWIFNGNLGVGITSPTAKFHINTGNVTASTVDAIMIGGRGGSGARQIGLYQATNSAGTGLEQYLFLNGALDLENTVYGSPKISSNFAGGTFLYGYDGGIRIQGSNTAGTNVTPTHIATFANSGNVGIGTTAPGYKLQVQGDTKINGVLNDAWQIIGTSTTFTNSNTWEFTGLNPNKRYRVSYNLRYVGGTSDYVLIRFNNDSTAARYYELVNGVEYGGQPTGNYYNYGYLYLSPWRLVTGGSNFGTLEFSANYPNSDVVYMTGQGCISSTAFVMYSLGCRYNAGAAFSSMSIKIYSDTATFNGKVQIMQLQD